MTGVAYLNNQSCVAIFDSFHRKSNLTWPCVASSCGDIHNICDPFRLKSDSKECDIWNYELVCEGNRTVLYLKGGRYYVLSIDYSNSQIRLVDDGIHKGNCSSLPHHWLTHDDKPLDLLHSMISDHKIFNVPYEVINRVVIVNCSKPVNSSFYITINPSCTVGLYSSNTSSSWKLYALANPKASDTRHFCTILSGTWVNEQINISLLNYEQIHNIMANGFLLDYPILDADDATNSTCALTLNFHSILTGQNIKKITANFKHKLGEGGYGSVYKGTLQSGNEVAIKILKQSKGQGQDFINEVATIGRIYHANVVQLIGFCFEGSKQALVYDLMSNGSLDKQIFTKEGDKFLDYKKIYEIALGVARGIEYLHQGCDMQILHFDIKPHNILLDKNFTPKVSDFGLAKLYPANHSIVSLTIARGTLGYMALELFYRNIGGVSYKADVYSFGMLLMEMAGRRKNINANAEHSSQIYFPLWVYDQVSEEKRVEIEIVAEERKVIKKMIIVALWCIQLNPDHRPSMSKVLKMLDGDIDELQMPPKPLIYPPNVPVNNDEAEMELETFSTSSSTPIINTSFPLGDTNDV
ncbi:rust resistance kinase Lr10-like [Eucalyptus grandis]|uniref:rust resistance kinase Lr10-like n=1 Tax=Eucalyptus grandis TaxID=71139 RepID=UPI00192ECD1A|nr:rust resistance kinase Lr10-like [Eucalyptus grandis]